ncbi:hypothetical protein EON82_11440 [bacterium]|nr:MAG: hypothetical protein EON82_11440 [bacterium]
MQTWNNPGIVVVGEESVPAVMKLFGREPSVEDWRYVGRWSYGSAWLAVDQATARDLVYARFLGTAEAAMAAAKNAGRGNGDRAALVNAIGRLPEALRTGKGPFASIVSAAIDEAVEQLLEEGQRLRKQTESERSLFAPRFHTDGFVGAMNEVGVHRVVLLKEVLGQLQDALALANEGCPALKAMALFLNSILGVDSHESTSTFECMEDKSGPLARMGMWLVADVALTSRRAARYSKAWATSARSCGDPISKMVAGLTSGAMQSHHVAEAIYADPWALIVALAMTSEAEHASALLDYGVQAQQQHRSRAATEIRQWSAAVLRADELERKVGIAVLAPYEEREGCRECPMASDADLLTAWHWGATAELAAASLTRAIEQCVATELGRRAAAVRSAKTSVDGVRAARESMIEAAKHEFEETLRHGSAAARLQNDAGAQKGCLFGMGAGCSVMGTYIAICVVAGTAGIVGKVAPLVVAIAALPMGAAIVVQVASSLRRSALNAEDAKRREAAKEKFERAKKAAEELTSAALEKGRRSLEEAETKLTSFEQQVGRSAKGAA